MTLSSAWCIPIQDAAAGTAMKYAIFNIKVTRLVVPERDDGDELGDL